MGLKVIGAGLGRTGTMSLKLALEHVGFGPCYHMIELRKHPAAAGLWDAAGRGGKPDWTSIFEGYAASVDWPSATFYRQLAEAYPEAKVILTLRDPGDWFESTQATIFKMDVPDPPTNVFESMVRNVVTAMFDHRMHDREHLISIFERHNAEVKATIPADRLLVYNAAESWEPLCRFLNVPIPQDPMPKVNSRDDFWRYTALDDAPDRKG